MAQPQPVEPAERHAPQSRPALAVFAAFLRLGLVSFGGPVAHLGYFRTYFVTRHNWLTEVAYADLVALGQFLPGPASSQVGFAIGLGQAGLMGGLAAFTGFTLPSAVLMLAAAFGAGALPAWLQPHLVHGLVLVSAPVVAHAVIGMAWRLCRGAIPAVMALAAFAATALTGLAWIQPAVIAAGALAGAVWLSPRSLEPAQQSGPAPAAPPWAPACLVLFAGVLLMLPLLAAVFPTPALMVADSFYRSGALVFGGGHVVLPLLEAETAGHGWLDPQTFMSGYGLAQALPGPLFAFAAYLGAASTTGLPAMAGGVLALLAIFLPGLLVMAGVLPFWTRLKAIPWAQGSSSGAGAAVVGILAAALWNPVLVTGVTSPVDAVLAAAGLAALLTRVPAWLVVVIIALGGAYASFGAG